MKLIYHKVGKKFKVCGKKYVFRESKIADEIENCYSCDLDNNQELCFRMVCAANERPDRKNTIVKEIKTNANRQSN